MTATRLADGRVLAVGGAPNQGGVGYDEAFLINTDGTWTQTTSMPVGRDSHIAALLPNGRVLVSGGTGTGTLGPDSTGTTYLTSSDVFDPATGTWSGAPAAPGSLRRSTTLSDGRVFAIALDGGVSVFDPSGSSWCTTAPAPSASLSVIAIADAAVIGFAASGAHRFTFDDGPSTPGVGTLDITEVRWVIEVEADTVRVGGALAAESAGERWEATTALPGAGDNTVNIQWTVGTATRTATASANEVIVPLGGG